MQVFDVFVCVRVHVRVSDVRFVSGVLMHMCMCVCWVMLYLRCIVCVCMIYLVNLYLNLPLSVCLSLSSIYLVYLYTRIHILVTLGSIGIIQRRSSLVSASGGGTLYVCVMCVCACV